MFFAHFRPLERREAPLLRHRPSFLDWDRRRLSTRRMCRRFQDEGTSSVCIRSSSASSSSSTSGIWWLCSAIKSSRKVTDRCFKAAVRCFATCSLSNPESDCLESRDRLDCVCITLSCILREKSWYENPTLPSTSSGWLAKKMRPVRFLDNSRSHVSEYLL